MPRGRLRVYLGAAPGVGKTYAMLAEGHRRQARGTDVVVGFVETHSRPRTAALLDGLEEVPRVGRTYRGGVFTEMDTEAVIARRPQVVLVDELAHTNVPGSLHPKRWQDVDRLLDAGIDVISTVNIQHLESVNDVVRQITGVVQRETVPDEAVRRAEQVELVDMAPEALRRRMAHGNIYPPEKIDAALANYFRLGNLTALRELALLWLADQVDDQLDSYRAAHSIESTWETRERVVVALSGGPEGQTLLRRAARIAARSRGADLLAVHVSHDDGLTPRARPTELTRQRILAESLGGSFHQVVGADVPTALLEFARGVNATQLVLGVSRQGRLARLFSRDTAATTTARSGSIDVHLVTHEAVGDTGPRLPRSVLTRRRLWAGFALAVLGLPLLTAVLTLTQAGLTLGSDILLFLFAVVVVALVGGVWPALLAAVTGSLLLNFFFTPPLRQFVVARPGDLLSLVVFLLVAALVSAVVDTASRRTGEAARAGADAELLAILAGDVLRGGDVVARLLDRMREAFALSGVTLLARLGVPVPGDEHDPAAWQAVANSGDQACASPDQAQVRVAVEADLALALRGRTLPAADRRVLEAFAGQIALALRQRRLAAEAEQARPLAEADRMRTALLAAVSHDLRTPLAAAKAAVKSLGAQDVVWDEDEREELRQTAEESLARLDRLVANLLDMSRLQAGALHLASQSLTVEEILPGVLAEAGDGRVEVLLEEGLPDLVADPALLERVLVNLVANALRYSPPERPVLVSASAHGGQVQLRVTDRGPGIPPAEQEAVFRPFQRLGDRDNHTGVGLGLALARGLTEAMAGTLVPEETPGGGLTMTVTLPAAEVAADFPLLDNDGREHR